MKARANNTSLRSILNEKMPSSSERSRLVPGVAWNDQGKQMTAINRFRGPADRHHHQFVRYRRDRYSDLLIDMFTRSDSRQEK